jgi:hypothetical protein
MRKLHNVNVKMAEWLNRFKWTYFFTLTTGYELTIKSARRLAERWFLLMGVPGSRIFWVCEKNECRDGSHLHGLLYINDNDPLFGSEVFNPFQKCIKTWQIVSRNNSKRRGEYNFNRCQFKRYDEKKGAAGYCAKYLLKKNADYDFIG